MNINKKVSVVVCTKNNEKTIKRTLESISRTKPLEIIIIDGGSSDKTLDIAKEFTSRIYSDHGRGLGYARYLGAKLARGDYVAYIDSDVIIPSPDFFENLLGEMHSKNWVGIHAQIKTSSVKNYWEEGMDFYFRNRFNLPGERIELPMMACIIRRDVILEIGFDIHIKGAGEDQDFWRRAYSRGYKFGVSSREWVFHQHRSSFREFIKQRIWYGKGNVMLFSKYRDWKKIMSPFGAIAGGILLSFKRRKLKYFPFFIIWGVALGIGEYSKNIIFGHRGVEKWDIYLRKR